MLKWSFITLSADLRSSRMWLRQGKCKCTAIVHVSLIGLEFTKRYILFLFGESK